MKSSRLPSAFLIIALAAAAAVAYGSPDKPGTGAAEHPPTRQPQADPTRSEQEFAGISEARSFEAALADALRNMDKAVADQKVPCNLASWRIVEIRGQSGGPGGLNTLEVRIAASFETRDGAEPPAETRSVREIFRPTTRASGQTSWTRLVPRKIAGSQQLMMIVNAHRGDRWPVTLQGAAEPLFQVELVDGDENAVELRVIDGTQSRTLSLKRDRPLPVRVGESEFRITYGTSMVAGREPVHVDHATITVTRPVADQ